MDRKKYLEICQRVSMLPGRVMGIKENVPKELRVVFNNIEYYPFGYTICFDQSGIPIHCAILHDLRANSIMSAPLEKVREFMA